MQNGIKFNPPQPIPYPHSKVTRAIYRIPLWIYRLGISRLLGKYILILSTFGRKTGKVHRTPVEYFRQNGQLFVMSGFGTHPDWFKNLQMDPRVTIQMGQNILHAIARKPQTEHEWDGVIAFLKSSPVAKLSQPDLLEKLGSSEIRAAIKTWPILTFDPTDEACPPPLKSDLIWTWPLILIDIALFVFIYWLFSRNDCKKCS